LLSQRLRLALFALVLLTLAGCGPSAAPAAPTAAPTKPGATPPSAIQVTTNLSPLPKPSASPGAAASPSAQGGPVSAAPKQFPSAPPMALDAAATAASPSKKYVATINTTLGTMHADLYANETPVTVNNFVFLSQQGFYTNVPFHRIINGFMVQTGDAIRRDGTGNPGYQFNDEPVKRAYDKGTLAMANAGPNTNGSQFFIVQGTNVNLPPNYTIFGHLTDGLDTLDKIAGVPVGPSPSGERSKPVTEVDISSITIDEVPA
jgi:cyclophilin family peptidyl-prolyl cis-trans isomerase